MKAASELVVNAAVGHVIESCDDEVAQGVSGRWRRWTAGGGRRHMSIGSFGARVPFDQQIKGGGMRELRRLPKAAMLRIVHARSRSLNRGNHRGRDPAIFSGEGFRLGDRAL